jgi:hypothetical protein
VGLVEDIARPSHANGAKARGDGTRTAVMSLFGAMNWLYTWHNPKSDPGADTLSRQISDLFLQGITGTVMPTRAAKRNLQPGHKAVRAGRELSRSADE